MHDASIAFSLTKYINTVIISTMNWTKSSKAYIIKSSL